MVLVTPRVFSLQRSTARVFFVVPFRILSWKNITGDNALELVFLRGEKATPTKQDLGTA